MSSYPHASAHTSMSRLRPHTTHGDACVTWCPLGPFTARRATAFTLPLHSLSTPHLIRINTRRPSLDKNRPLVKAPSYQQTAAELSASVGKAGLAPCDARVSLSQATIGVVGESTCDRTGCNWSTMKISGFRIDWLIFCDNRISKINVVWRGRLSLALMAA